MRLITFLLLLILPVLGMADTSDYYHVYFRGKMIGNYSEGKTIRVVMKADSIGTFDSVKVDVHRDAPCANCTYNLLIFGGKGPMYMDSTQHSEDFYVPLAPLVAEFRKTGTYSFNGYYTQYFTDPTKSKVVAFEIRLL